MTYEIAYNMDQFNVLWLGPNSWKQHEPIHRTANTKLTKEWNSMSLNVELLQYDDFRCPVGI